MGKQSDEAQELKAILDTHFHWDYEFSSNPIPGASDHDIEITIPNKTVQEIYALKAILSMAGYEVAVSPDSAQLNTNWTLFSFALIDKSIFIGAHA